MYKSAAALSLLVFGTCSFASPGQAASKGLPGFHGARWGDSKAIAIAALKKRFKLIKEDTGGAFFYGDFGGRHDVVMRAYFAAGKLWQVRIMLEPLPGETTIDTIDGVAGSLRKVYGQPSQTAIISDVGTTAVSVAELIKWTQENSDEILSGEMSISFEWAFPGRSYITTWTSQDDEGNRTVNVDYYSDAVKEAADRKALEDF